MTVRGVNVRWIPNLRKLKHLRPDEVRAFPVHKWTPRYTSASTPATTHSTNGLAQSPRAVSPQVLDEFLLVEREQRHGRSVFVDRYHRRVRDQHPAALHTELDSEAENSLRVGRCVAHDDLQRRIALRRRCCGVVVCSGIPQMEARQSASSGSAVILLPSGVGSGMQDRT